MAQELATPTLNTPPPSAKKEEEMDYLKVAGAKASPKRGLFRLPKIRNHHNNNNNGRVLESIAKLSGGSVVSQSKEEGVVRIKIVVRKQDLDKMLKVMRGDESDRGIKRSAEKSCVEQRLNLLRKKHARKGSWTPALQSIPEDF